MYYEFYVFSSLSLKSCFIDHFLSLDPCKNIIITSHLKKFSTKAKYVKYIIIQVLKGGIFQAKFLAKKKNNYFRQYKATIGKSLNALYFFYLT